MNSSFLWTTTPRPSLGMISWKIMFKESAIGKSKSWERCTRRKRWSWSSRLGFQRSPLHSTRVTPSTNSFSVSLCTRASPITTLKLARTRVEDWQPWLQSTTKMGRETTWSSLIVILNGPSAFTIFLSTTNCPPIFALEQRKVLPPLWWKITFTQVGQSLSQARQPLQTKTKICWLKGTSTCAATQNTHSLLITFTKGFLPGTRVCTKTKLWISSLKTTSNYKKWQQRLSARCLNRYLRLSKRQHPNSESKKSRKNSQKRPNLNFRVTIMMRPMFLNTWTCNTQGSAGLLIC